MDPHGERGRTVPARVGDAGIEEELVAEDDLDGFEEPPAVEQAEAEPEAPLPEPAAAATDVIPDELPLDTDWDDIYDGATSYSARDPDDDYDPLEHQSEAGGSLREHLLWQATLSTFTDRDRLIAEAIIDAVRDDG